eukprot:CAMPEP_0115447298 /NCGR_PEP_ID=MMETSP0271-20121206/39896_1 /TAXON_ID=71861 /ORGANISM="Scrippsiella trochoidea, Strain CCMP3099" /LENGTH=80 /DNA_ID=CAMNT_0002873369 /DNA_START=61 /DNA_END=303 /DNA_ORIENTATION=-
MSNQGVGSLLPKTTLIKTVTPRRPWVRSVTPPWYHMSWLQLEPQTRLHLRVPFATERLEATLTTGTANQDLAPGTDNVGA